MSGGGTYSTVYNDMSVTLNSPTSISMYLDHCANPHATLDVGSFTGGRLLIVLSGQRRTDALWGDGFYVNFFFNQSDGLVPMNYTMNQTLPSGNDNPQSHQESNVTTLSIMDPFTIRVYSYNFTSSITLEIPQDSPTQVSMRLLGLGHPQWISSEFDFVDQSSWTPPAFSYCTFGDHGRNWLDIDHVGIQHISSTDTPSSASPSAAPTVAPTGTSSALTAIR